MATQALVTVGGKGSRLRSAGLNFPCTKSFINVLGEPLIFWNLKIFKRIGLRRIVFCADSEEALNSVKLLTCRAGNEDIDFLFYLDEGLGTSGLPFHFRNQFDGPFFFITGHSFVTVQHFNAMRSASGPGMVTVSTYREQNTKKNIRTDGIGRLVPPSANLPMSCRMIDYPYLLDKIYCERIARNGFNVLPTLEQFFFEKAIRFVHSEMPVEIDEPEQFQINMKAIEDMILEASLA